MKHAFTIYKRPFEAYSLIETIVASVIFMIIFLIGMHTLTSLVKYDIADTSYLLMENELQKLRKKIILNEYPPTERDYTYEWGDVNIQITPYKDHIYMVRLTAVSKQKKKTISYRFLQATP